MLRQSTARRTASLLRSANTTYTASSSSSSSRVALQRRFASSGGDPVVPPPPSQKQRSWRNRLVRLGLAGGAIYFYNTSSVFADEPTFSLRSQLEESKETLAVNVRNDKKPAATQQETQQETQQQQQQDSVDVQPEQPQQPGNGESGGLDELESQAGTEGAFNPETGEINWDCPCLGGMAYGPCGEDFKAAFSCFVYSTEEPKGMDCIEKFKAMQDCFRLHPEIYGSELDEEEVDEQLTEQIAQRDKQDQAAQQSELQQQPQQVYTNDPASASLNQAEKRAEVEEIHKANEHSQQAAREEENLVPRAWHASEEGKTTEK
ncbi:Mitochondrial intermembrane space import and assembly protein 40 [Talaromyces islandicus]|uniref:Mitochondrial intermembrane space import and assembly protein 40 n=1 Tax=Talaromyces islandicus TaxID=28573 RepID=A0A0U1M0K2_TALIS|nr:Mitochondrial intermembrane space import and assembly protein 40 [Talaromyces islandicus]